METQFYVFNRDEFDKAMLGLPPATALMLMHALYDPKPVVFRCSSCGQVIMYQDCPTGGWWYHENHPQDKRHDAVCGGYGPYDDD